VKRLTIEINHFWFIFHFFSSSFFYNFIKSPKTTTTTTKRAINRQNKNQKLFTLAATQLNSEMNEINILLKQKR
jgi:hypothetical protein